MPFSRHTIEVAEVDEGGRRLVTEERGGLLRRWRHTIEVRPAGAGTCRYSDTVEIDAGPLTPVVAAVARVFYRLRQRRWRALAPFLAVPQRPPAP
ncbi:MAG TPA: hypothetical protein VD813_09275 [Pseudonocardia sp.]|nr:hypothetical protein [Pseudonocardia sp.]